MAMNSCGIFFVSYSVISALFLSTANSLQCMNEDNKPVDWFALYKLPTIKHHHKLLKDGVGYTFISSDSYNTWTFSNKSINDTQSFLANTLNSLYNNDLTSTVHILYNDQPPSKKQKANKGHTKGVVLANNDGGLWLVHSVPEFPVLQKTYVYPRTGAVYGQSFLCISLDLKNLNEVGKQMQYNEPEIYSQNIPDNLQTSLPDLTNAALNVTVKSAPWFRSTILVSKANIQFVSYAKSKNFGKDLYEDWVAPSLQSNLFVETWPNGADRLNSSCIRPFKVNNIQSVTMATANVTFTTTHDHSKWAVSTKGDWACIGDINRMKHQEVRGGGTVCLNNKKVAKDYLKLVNSTQDCPSTNF